VILSSGLSGWDDITRAVDTVRAAGAPVALLQATTSYPTPPDKLGLNILAQLRERYGIPVGLSDHSGTIYSGLAAHALGARFLEVHVTLSRYMFGPDVSSSITVEQLADLAKGLRFLATAFAHPVDKEKMADEMAPLRSIFQKSVVARTDIPAGTVLRREARNRAPARQPRQPRRPAPQAAAEGGRADQEGRPCRLKACNA
jgi:N-acetylneuraminate synthase